MPKIENFVPAHIASQADEKQLKNVIECYKKTPKIHSDNFTISDDNLCYLKYKISDGDDEKLFYITRIDSNPNLFFNEGILVHSDGSYQRACLNLFGVINEGGDLQELDLNFKPKTVAEVTATLGPQIFNN